MEQKTKVTAEDGKQEIWITREFDLPVELLFKAYTEAEFVEQWMGTKVLKLESQKHGSYQFETTDPKGNKYRFNGAIHNVSPNEKISRTFEFEGMPLAVQLELLTFEQLTEATSKLTIQSIYGSVAKRDEVLKMPFKQGINMAHDRLENVMSNLNK